MTLSIASDHIACGNNLVYPNMQTYPRICFIHQSKKPF